MMLNGTHELTPVGSRAWEYRVSIQLQSIIRSSDISSEPKQLRIHVRISPVRWAGALIEIRSLFCLNSAVRKKTRDRPTDGWTNRWTDQWKNFLHPSVLLPSIRPCIPPYIHTSIFPSFHLSTRLSGLEACLAGHETCLAGPEA